MILRTLNLILRYAPFPPAYHQNETGETDGGIHAENRWNALRLLRPARHAGADRGRGSGVNEVTRGRGAVYFQPGPAPVDLAVAALAKVALPRSWKPDSSMTTSATESITLPVLGMTCASCQHHVEEALRATAGVESARVDLMAHRASVDFDPAMATPAQMVEAIRAAGYDAVLPRADGLRKNRGGAQRWSRA